MPDKTILLLGGAGLIGTRIAREIARDIHPKKIIVASLYQREVRETITPLEKEFPGIKFVGVWGDVFVRADFTGERRAVLMQSAARREHLFADLLGDLDDAYARSRLVRLILEHKPNVIIDSINTATAISYQDVYSASIIAKQTLGALFARIDALNEQMHALTSTPTPRKSPPGGNPYEIESEDARDDLRHLPLGKGEGGEGVAEAVSRERGEYVNVAKGHVEENLFDPGSGRKSHLHRTRVQVSRGGNPDSLESDNARDDLRGIAPQGVAGSATRSPLREELHKGIAELARMRKAAEGAFDALVLSQAVPQLIRHVILILRAMEEVGTRLYLKIGTTGTGGMGLNIPYTHGEDKPSAKLMSKTAVAFAHTGLMFLMARTPGAPIVKEIKPAAMVGYSDITMRSITEQGKPVYIYNSVNEPLQDALVLRDDPARYEKLGNLEMVILDAGENGMFTQGEFEAITALRQMEFITPEEIASKVVLEIKGANTGTDVIAAIDGAVMDPTYRAGYLRRVAIEEIQRLEQETGVPSIALGQLGPPELSKLLYEAYLLKARYHSLGSVLRQRPKKIADALYRYILRRDDLRHMIVSVGLPILAPDALHILRGPFIRIPERPDTNRVPLTMDEIDRYARKGWVDLRPENFVRWKERIEKMRRAQQQIRGRGSAAITMDAYLTEEIHIGEVVAWVLNKEVGGYRIK